MGFIKSALQQLLSPKSNLEGIPSLVNPNQNDTAPGDDLPRPSLGRLRGRDIWLNPPLILGGLIVLGLFLLVLFGPVWAPENPYLAGQHIKADYDTGPLRFVDPPLSPSPQFPLGTDQWGNDLLSLLMHGARNTLVACAFVTMVRIIVGLMFGAAAGWNEGKTIDRFMMGLSGVIASVPMLISSMILVLALDIRRGLPVFIIALSAIGWTEVAQYIRSEFMVLRKMPYLEGAWSVGTNALEVAVRHILPNVLPQLLIIAFLEMGAVMLLLGELGFVGVFIGGGSRIALDLNASDTISIHTLAEIPEWGAMLATGFRFLRTKPFVALPPAIAFFISVLGFNTLGEGLRRLIERAPISTAFLLRKRMLLVIAVLSGATVFIVNNANPTPWFVKAAEGFSGSAALQHVANLTELDGRGIGQAGSEQAAAYIAGHFEESNLDPGWKRNSYYYEFETQVVRPIQQPYLGIVSSEGSVLREFRHQLDFSFEIEGHGGAGATQAPVTFVGFQPGQASPDPQAFTGLDLRGRIVMLLAENAPHDFVTEAQIRGAQGILWVVSSQGEKDLHSQVFFADPTKDYLRKPTMPIFRVSEDVASMILGQDGLTLSDLFDHMGQLDQSESGWFTRELASRVKMSLVLGDPEEAVIPSVMGYMPGSDLALADELVVLIARYDGLGVDPDGTVFPGANHDASGVAMLIELARLWQEQKLGPRRSVLFVAWGGGLGNDFAAQDFLDEGLTFAHLPTRNPYADLRPTMIFEVDYAGAGGEGLLLHPANRDDLTLLLTETASEVGVPTTDTDSLSTLEAFSSGQVSFAIFRWSQADGGRVEDTYERIELEKIQSLGEVFTLAMTKIVRQTTY